VCVCVCVCARERGCVYMHAHVGVPACVRPCTSACVSARVCAHTPECRASVRACVHVCMCVSVSLDIYSGTGHIALKPCMTCNLPNIWTISNESGTEQCHSATGLLHASANSLMTLRRPLQLALPQRRACAEACWESGACLVLVGRDQLVGSLSCIAKDKLVAWKTWRGPLIYVALLPLDVMVIPWLSRGQTLYNHNTPALTERASFIC
jgi:hypothetical protein